MYSLLPRWRVARWRLLFAVKGLTLSLVRESEFVKYFLISIVYTDAQLPLACKFGSFKEGTLSLPHTALWMTLQLILALRQPRTRNYAGTRSDGKNSSFIFCFRCC